MKLNDKYYDAIVIGNEVDVNHQGAVRVKILGITEELKDDQQPFALPGTNSITAVPTRGTYLKVSFDEGDINKPKYFDFSPDKNYLPQEYWEEYPHVAVANLGGDFFIMTHNRDQKETLITHPSDSTINWNFFGTIIHESDNGYGNAGMGADSGQGAKIQPVLTQGTVDVFCCTPVGEGQTLQGSEYLQVTHVSKGTVDRINGIAPPDDTNINPESEGESVDIDATRLLLDKKIAFIPHPEPNPIDNQPRKNPKSIKVTYTTDTNFYDLSYELMKGTADPIHYLIGVSKFTPPSSSTTEIINDNNAGLAQYVDLEFNASDAKGDDGSIMVTVIAKNVDDANEWQDGILKNIEDHVNAVFNTDDIEIAD